MTDNELRRPDEADFERLALLRALVAAIRDPHRVLDVVLQSAGAEAALDALCREFELERNPAQAILDMQFRQLSDERRSLLINEMEEMEAWVDGP